MRTHLKIYRQFPPLVREQSQPELPTLKMSRSSPSQVDVYVFLVLGDTPWQHVFQDAAILGRRETWRLCTSDFASPCGLWGILWTNAIFVSPAGITVRSSVHPSVCLSVCLSVRHTFSVRTSHSFRPKPGQVTHVFRRTPNSSLSLRYDPNPGNTVP